jgi:hypothetical protein
MGELESGLGLLVGESAALAGRCGSELIVSCVATGRRPLHDRLSSWPAELIAAHFSPREPPVKQFWWSRRLDKR